MSADPTSAKSIFLNAAERPAGGERTAYLAAACGPDGALRREVDELLAHHGQVGSFLEVPGVGPTVDVPPAAEVSGNAIGPYKLLQQIGEGGMGTVFMAEQTHPVQRKVALKVIRAGMDTRQVVARFEAERQALAMMDHVNIARVLDAGTTDRGRPYFVMELVHGVPITRYCDDNHLTPRQRLELFVPVCHAIQHAHQKGIIHRDVKPSNVLVTLYDGRPVPKVIDFGVAKATEQRLTERILFTQYGTAVGTLEYMSPEQAEMSALGVDTRSDIYSLGVLLYELLTGSTPLTQKRLKEAAYGEILRLIREEEPQRPSTRLTDSGEALASISAQRRTEPAKLSRLMRGELDWIVMKTLEKDRSRRYESANAFAADVQRYLADETVLACPPSAGYRFRKFVRRSRVILIPLAAVAVALVLGAAISAWLAVEANRARAEASRGWEAEKAERYRAVAAGRRAQESLYEARLAQVDVGHGGGQPGQRFASLAALAEGGTLARELNLGPVALLDVRNRAIVSLTRADLRARPGGQKETVRGTLLEHVNGSERYVSGFGSGSVWVQSRKDPGDQVQIPIPGYYGGTPPLSPCGRFLGACVQVRGSKEAQVWDVDRRAVVLRVPDAVVLGFSPDFRHVVAGLGDGSLRAFDLPNGDEVKRVASGAPNGSQLHVQPGGARVAVTGGPEVRVLDLATGGVVATLAPDRPLTGPGPVWHPHRQLLALCTSTQILLWAPGSGEKPQVLDGHARATRAIAFSQGGSLLASAGEDATIRLWDTWTGRPLLTFPARAHGLAFTAGDRLLAYQSGQVGYLDVAAGEECRTLVDRTNRKLEEIDISPDGRWLAANAGGHVGLWDVESGREAGVGAVLALSSIAFDPSNGDLVARGPDFERRYAVKAGDGAVTLLPAPAGARPDDFRPRGQFLFADPGDPNPKRSAISADGRWLVKGILAPRRVAMKLPPLKPPRGAMPAWSLPALIDRKAGTIRELPGDGGGDHGTQVAISPDARQLVVAATRAYHLWHVDPLRRSAVLARQESNVTGPLAFSPEGKMLAVARSPWDVSLIDPESLEELATLRARDPEELTWLCFSPDGRRLAAGTHDGRIQVWDLGSIRRQLAGIGLDWSLRPWGPGGGK